MNANKKRIILFVCGLDILTIFPADNKMNLQKIYSEFKYVSELKGVEHG